MARMAGPEHYRVPLLVQLRSSIVNCLYFRLFDGLNVSD